MPLVWVVSRPDFWMALSCMSCHQSLSNALGRDFVGMLGSFR